MSFARKALAVSFVAACSVEPLPPQGLGEAERGAGENPRHKRDERVSSMTIEQMPPPMTRWPMVSLRGRGPIGGQIHYWEDSKRRRMDIDIGPDGRFCIDLKLTRATSTRPQRKNVFSLQGSSDSTEGGLSQPQQVIVTHVYSAEGSETTEASPPPATVLSDRLKSSTVRTNLVSDVSPAILTDGDERATVRLGGHPAEPSWIRFALSEPGVLHEVQVIGAGQCAPSDYTVYVSDAIGDPGVPSPEAGWRAVGEVSGASLRQAVKVEEPTQARHLGMVFSGSACAVGGQGRFDLAEVRALSKDETPGSNHQLAFVSDTEPKLCGADGVP